jgi:biopolymer transport protein ExbD
MKKRFEYLSPDLTPLIDVVFILLIFFIITSSFKKDNTVLKLELPNSNSTTKVIDKKNISIELNKKALAYMGKTLTITQLQTKLEKITNKKQAIMINISKDVPYNKVIELLDILQLNNLNNIAFVTKKN